MPHEDSGLTLGLKPGVRADDADHWLFVNRCAKSSGARRCKGWRWSRAALRPVGFQAMSKPPKVYVVPGCDEVFLRIRTSVAFDQDAELRVSAKNKLVHCGAIAGLRALKMYF